jgi:hypothetical protein
MTSGNTEDTRGRNGRRHELPFVFGVCVVAVLAGAKGYAEIARRARGMARRLLAALGADWDWFRSRRKHPSEELSVACCPRLMPR